MTPGPQTDVQPASTQKNAISSAATFFVTAAIAFLLTPRIVTALGDARYGVLTLASEFIGYYSLLDLGIRGAVGYYVSRFAAERRSADTQEVVRTAFWNLCAVAGCVLLLAAATAWYFPRLINIGSVPAGEARLAVAILLAAFAVNLPGSIPTGVLVGLRRFDVANGCQIAASMLTGSALVLLLATGRANLVSVSAVQACGSILSWAFQGLSLRALSFRVSLWPPRLRSGHTKAIYTYGGANLLITVAQVFGFQADALIIGSTIGPAAVSRFHMGRYVALHLMTLLGSVAMTLPTAFTHAAANHDTPGVRRLFVQASRMILAIASLACAGIFVFGRSFLQLWVGPAYLAGDWWNRSDTVLYLMTGHTWFRCAVVVAHQYLLGVRKLRFQVVLRVSEAAVNLTMAIVLARSFGIAGVSMSRVVVAFVASMLLLLPYALSLMKVSAAEYAGRILAPALLVGGATAAAGLAGTYLQEPSTWRLFFMEVFAAGAAGASVLWFSALDRDMRQSYLTKLRSMFVR